MSRYSIQRNMITRLVTSPVVLTLVAFVVLAVAATPAKAAEPVIRQVLGVDFGATINGRTNISAKIGGDPDQVVFALSGPLSRTSVRTKSPYFFLSNAEGNPRYWNTANAPEGAYTMNVRVIKDGRVADSVAINFTIDHSAVDQNTLPRKQRVRTAMLGDSTASNDTAIPASASGDDGTITDAKRSTQPIVDFVGDAFDTYERGSGEDIAITVSGKMSGNADILVIAWDFDRRQIVDAFAHLVDKNNPRVTSDKLDLLPDGNMQIQLLYRERSVIQYKKLHSLTVVTPVGSVDLGNDQPVDQIDPTKIIDISGIESGATLTGAVSIEVAISGDAPDEVIFNVTGPEELTYIKKNAPYVFLGDGASWDTSKHANGQYSVTITTLIGGDQTDTKTINFTINNVVILPDPIVAFNSDAPAEYRLGEGISIPYSVDRELPDNATVLVLAWSAANWGMVNEFAHYVDNGPWIISAEKMSLLEPGRAQLQLMYRVDNKTIYKRTHDLQVLAAYGSEPVDDTVVDNGTDTGNSGSVDNGTTDTGDANPPEDTTTAGGNTGSTGGTDTGGTDGGSGTADGGGTADNGGSDTGNTTPPDTVVNTDQSPVLGMNLSFVTYWTREWVFTNVLRQSQKWTSTNTGGNPYNAERNIPTDANGWPILQPGHAASTITLNGHNSPYPGGKYICTYDGEGDIVFAWDAKNGASQPGRIEVNVNPTASGIYMRIENSNPSNHVRNVKLVHEDLVDHPSSFHPLFVERLKPFKTLRFMDWQRTNTTHQRVWSDRVTPDFHTQGERGGVSIELLIELCNELGADPWVCMPAQADDDYIRRFAQLVKDRLHADGKVYVEWSNEVWNTQFEVHKRIKAETDNQTFSDQFFGKWAGETKRDFDIWTSVWGADSNRVVRVAAGQAGLSWGTNNLLKRLDGKFDAVSCSTYFGIPYPIEKTLTSGTTVNDIIEMLEENIVNDNREFYAAHSQLAKDYGEQYGRHIKLIAYEGGQHLADSGQNKPHKAALIAAQDDPRMYDLYQQNMFEFERAGGTDRLHVGRRDQWGSWGHLRYQDEPLSQALKFRAMLDYPGSQKRLELTTFD